VKYNKNQILIKQLPAAVIIKNFIDGHPADCEEYFKDFINSSKLAKEKGNEAFFLRKHDEQSQGQSDIYNSFYELDFKILVDTKHMEAKSMLSHSITEFYPGVTAVGCSRLQGSKTVYDIIKSLRYKRIEDLISIENGKLRVPESRVIKQIINKISVDKNILFFLPYDYFFEKKETDQDIAKIIVNCIAEDLKGLFEYRKMKVKKDTYIAFISNGYFVITQEINNTLILYDMIKTKTSDMYNYLFYAGRL